MAEEKHCDECGGKLPADTPQGLCPQCLMKLGLPSKADPESALPTSPTAPTPFVPPEPKELANKFPQLEIIELLGQGGMGAVYKARQKHLDRLVALKILPPEISHDPAFAERFTREARSLARLSHPRIVTIYEFGNTDDGIYYFIMDYIDGTDLRQLIKAGQLSPKEALAIVPQICEALQFAHEEGIVHRDIKPENILIDKKGRIKIADFGLARLLDQPAKAYTLTQAGQRMGTPHYMAPEQIEHPAQVDHRADIYSLGVVFYEMLTGELPIGRFDPPSQKVQVDVRLDEIVLHTLEKEPERRYQHASELKTDVETVSASPQAPPPPPQQQHFNQRESSPMNTHITVVATLNIISGFIRLLIAAFLFTILSGIGLISGDPTAMAVMGIIGTAIGMIVGLMAIPTIIVCFGLLKRKPWARILMIILAFMDIAATPLTIMAGPAIIWQIVGIAVAIYTLWVLLSKEGARLFQTTSPANRTPQSHQSPSQTTARQTQTSQPKHHQGRSLLIFLAVALIALASVIFFTPAGKWLFPSEPAIPGQPLSFNLELPSEKIGQFDFPAGKPDHLTCKTGRLTLSENGASALDLTPQQVDRINEILRTAYAEYTEIERKNSRFTTSANSISVVVSPFRQQAAEFLENLWHRIDDVCDQSKRNLIHKHLPLGRIFGTFGFGKYRVSINISKRADRFAYSVSLHHTEHPGPMGQLAGISSDSSRTLPLDLHRFWNAEFGASVSTPRHAQAQSNIEKSTPNDTSHPDPCTAE